jgi:hypothetical protein
VTENLEIAEYQEGAADSSDTSVDPAVSQGSAQPVPVTMFDFEYNIMSDKPRLVEILAAAVNQEAVRIKSASPAYNRGSFNWPVEVAFKMALDRYYAQRALVECRRELAECRRDLENIASKVESDAEKLADLIDAGLSA